MKEIIYMQNPWAGRSYAHAIFFIVSPWREREQADDEISTRHCDDCAVYELTKLIDKTSVDVMRIPRTVKFQLENIARRTEVRDTSKTDVEALAHWLHAADGDLQNFALNSRVEITSTDLAYLQVDEVFDELDEIVLEVRGKVTVIPTECIAAYSGSAAVYLS